MESKIAVMTLFLVALISPAIVDAQQSILPSSIAGINTTTKSDAFVATKTSDAKADGWKDQHSFVEESNRFAKMFQTQAAEAGNPWRVPFYLLTPFAHGRESATAGIDTFPKSSLKVSVSG